MIGTLEMTRDEILTLVRSHLAEELEVGAAEIGGKLHIIGNQIATALQ